MKDKKKTKNNVRMMFDAGKKECKVILLTWKLQNEHLIVFIVDTATRKKGFSYITTEHTKTCETQTINGQ